jgi:hypothetical protein
VAENPPSAARASILAQIPDAKAVALEVDLWLQVLSRPGERLPAPARTRLAAAAGRAREAGIPLATVVATWLAVGSATHPESSDAAAHLRLISAGAATLCTGYADGEAEAIRREERRR